MIEGINNKMNIDILEYLNNPKYKHILVAEVLLQGINCGKYYVDMNEVNNYFGTSNMVDYISNAMKKI